MSQDHRSVLDWLRFCYSPNETGVVVVPMACVIRLANGKEYPAPIPIGEVSAHLRFTGIDSDKRPIYQSV